MPKNEEPQQPQPNNPLHGVKLATIIDDLVNEYGFQALGEMTGIKVFLNNPTQKSSLKMLRQTPWARERVENMYVKWLKKYKKSS